MTTGELRLKNGLTIHGYAAAAPLRDELAFLREMGAEFAEAYPKIAARLGMDGVEVADPYVERLLEGWHSCRRGCSWSWSCNIPRSPATCWKSSIRITWRPTPSMMVAALRARHGECRTG